jgi:hypothetical protein
MPESSGGSMRTTRDRVPALLSGWDASTERGDDEEWSIPDDRGDA